jgi:fucose permease
MLLLSFYSCLSFIQLIVSLSAAFSSFFHSTRTSAFVLSSLTSTKLEIYYNIDYTIISLVFLAPFVGYTLAAFLNNTVHMRFGQLGVAIIGPTCKIIAYAVICVHPPYPVLPVIFMFAGFGNGLEDSAWNAWIGNMENANEMLGFLHGAYGLGAAISPLIATAMVTKADLLWYNFYYLMVGFHPSF